MTVVCCDQQSRIPLANNKGLGCHFTAQSGVWCCGRSLSSRSPSSQSRRAALYPCLKSKTISFVIALELL